MPFLILAYTSLVQVYQNGSFLAAKWFILIVYTFISNLLHHWLFSDNSFFLIIDLVFKLGIVFLPEVISQSLEKVIAAFHLELIVNLIRAIIVPQICLACTLLIQSLLNHMTFNEQAQFKTLLLHVFERLGI